MKARLTLVGLAMLAWTQGSAQTITNYTTADGLLNDNVICLDVDGSDNIWFGTQAGVSMFDGATWTNFTTTSHPGLIDNNIQAIKAMNSGEVWVGTDFGASVYNGTSWTSYTTADGLGNNQIKCINEDAAGDIWFGTNSGATEYSGGTWTNYGTAEGLPFGGVVSIEEHSSGDIWMGTGLSGVRIFDGSTFTAITSTDGLIDDRIRAMVFDGSDNRWIGTSEGITVVNSSNSFAANHTTIFTLPAPDTLNPIEDVVMDSQGNIWAGIYVDYLVTEGGVSAYNGWTWVEYHVADGLVGPVVRALEVDSNDDVWVATSTGVSKISDPSVGINENESLVFEVYPNPATDFLTVRVASADEMLNVELYDATMQIVQQTSIAPGAQEVQISLHNVSAGIYFVKVNNTLKKIMRR